VRDADVQANIARGGYVLADFGAHDVRAVVIATGSEVPLALGARERLAAEGIGVRVVSMPCTEQFDRQDEAYRRNVMPPGVPRLAIEAGATDGWRKYVGALDDPHAGVIGIDRFGESAPAAALFAFFGFTVDNVVEAVRRISGRQRPAP
jgi:transketolase